MALPLVASSAHRVLLQAELAPLVIVRDTWGSRLYRRDVLEFVDNEGVRWSLLKTAVAHEGTHSLLERYWAAEARLQSCTWIERVPSASNLSDGPSRGEFALVRRLGFELIGLDLACFDLL